MQHPMTDPAGAGRKMLTLIGGILMGSMLPYIAAPWILWAYVLSMSSRMLACVLTLFVSLAFSAPGDLN